MFKFHEIGNYKTAHNIGFCEAKVVFRNGMGAVVDEAKKEATLPGASDTEIYVVMNKIDKPEIHTPNDFTVEVGEYPRLFELASIKNRLVDMDMDAVAASLKYTDIAVGDKLVYGTDGMLVKDSGTGTVGYEVVEKTAFGGEGILAKVFA